ncbi:phosphotransferase enzyme family protein [Enterococcus sp. HY326]|uniref:phosphotransferase enzyme family protein n=1 Tax=Enterococcus sp. HY326 TaxID=2971265 RepID=UPI002240B22E|nr:phosphotransferase [Enterococcus sp. HY326]
MTNIKSNQHPTTLTQILQQAEALYSFKVQKEIKNGLSGSWVFEGQADVSCILKISEYSKARAAHLNFETKWTANLAKNMTGIARPVLSSKNRLFETITTGDGKEYLLFLQEKVAGKLIDSESPAEFNLQLFENLGAVMGEMHQLTQHYPENQEDFSFAWNGPQIWRRNIPILDEAVSQREQGLIHQLASLPKETAVYGIVHFDIHPENFLVEETQITLIDFDACQFNWYAADIASTLFFIVQTAAGPQKKLAEEKRREFAEQFLIAYLKGYLEKKTIEPEWIRRLDLFMKYQMVDEYVAAQTYWQGDAADRQWYLQWFKGRLLDNLSYVEIDFDKVIYTVFSE